MKGINAIICLLWCQVTENDVCYNKREGLALCLFSIQFFFIPFSNVLQLISGMCWLFCWILIWVSVTQGDYDGRAVIVSWVTTSRAWRVKCIMAHQSIILIVRQRETLLIIHFGPDYWLRTCPVTLCFVIHHLIVWFHIFDCFWYKCFYIVDKIWLWANFILFCWTLNVQEETTPFSIQIFLTQIFDSSWCFQEY